MKFYKTFLFSLLFLNTVLSSIVFGEPLTNQSGMVQLKSEFTVKETIDRLSLALKSKGMTIFNRIKHSEAAEMVGIKINASELLIFGNPKIGSKLMQCSPSVALDLPLKALALQDDSGQVWLLYNRPTFLKNRHSIKGCGSVLQKMTKALNMFASKATGSSLPPLASSGSKMDKSALCAGCHGGNGIGLSDEYPNLAGQNKSYLIKQLLAFKTGSRVDPTMNAMAKSLSKNDIEALALHYSSLNSSTNSKRHSLADTATEEYSHASPKQFPDVMHVSMKGSGAIMSFPKEERWPGGPNMLYTAITPDGSMLLSTSPSTNTLYVFDTKSGETLSKIKVGKAPKGVKVSPNGEYAYVSNQGSANISIINLSALKLDSNIPVEDGPHNARFTKDGTKAYVTLQGGAGIGVIDTKRKQMVKVIPVPGITGPHNLDLSSNEKIAYVRDFVNNVAVLNLSTGKVLKIIPVGAGHGGIDVSPNNKWVATAAIGADFISVIDPKSYKVKNIQVGNGPHGIRFSKNNKWLYVTITKDNTLVVIDTNTMKVNKKIAVDKFPFWVAVNGNP